MADFSKKNYGGNLSGIQGDIERAFTKLRGDLTGSGTALDIAFESDLEPITDYWDPRPTTQKEAWDRLLVWLAARHPGDMPIT